MERLQRWFGGGGHGEKVKPELVKDDLVLGRRLVPEPAAPNNTAKATTSSATVKLASTAQPPTPLQQMEMPDIPSDASVTETRVCEHVRAHACFVITSVNVDLPVPFNISRFDRAFFL